MGDAYPSRPWDAIVGVYRDLVEDSGWEQMRPMLGLVEAIASSPYEPHLFALTSLDRLVIVRTRSVRMFHESLIVRFDPSERRFVFEYSEASPHPRPSPWATCCSASEGYAKLEWILHKRLRWFRPSGAPRRET